jgi:hypothetical protein
MRRFQWLLAFAIAAVIGGALSCSDTDDSPCSDGATCTDCNGAYGCLPDGGTCCGGPGEYCAKGESCESGACKKASGSAGSGTLGVAIAVPLVVCCLLGCGGAAYRRYANKNAGAVSQVHLKQSNLAHAGTYQELPGATVKTAPGALKLGNP